MNNFNKQIVYPKLIPRLFTATIDLLIISIVCTPIMRILSKYIFIFVFKDFFIQHQINLSDKQAMFQMMSSAEFAQFMTIGKLITYVGLLSLLNLLFIGAFFILFWRYMGTTPGKIILRMKVVDVDSLRKPSMLQSIKRFIYYFTAPFGIWSILFTNKRQALHDKMSNTMVIKN